MKKERQFCQSFPKPADGHLSSSQLSEPCERCQMSKVMSEWAVQRLNFSRVLNSNSGLTLLECAGTSFERLYSQKCFLSASELEDNIPLPDYLSEFLVREREKSAFGESTCSNVAQFEHQRWHLEILWKYSRRREVIREKLCKYAYTINAYTRINLGGDERYYHRK